MRRKFKYAVLTVVLVGSIVIVATPVFAPFVFVLGAGIILFNIVPAAIGVPLILSVFLLRPAKHS